MHLYKSVKIWTSHCRAIFLIPSFHAKPVIVLIIEQRKMEPPEPKKMSIFMKGWLWLKDVPSRLLAKLNEVSRQTTKIAKEDPRRLIHSLKVGSAVTLVSLLYYFQALYSSFGVSAMWAVMTVVVVFEFSVGATLAKCLNRGLATLAAGALGLGAHYLAGLTGKSSEPFLIGLFVFIQAAVSTFIRFFPNVKARYDYGMLVFILTFCLVSISGFRTDEVLRLAQTRVLTIVIGALTCVIICIFVFPVWAGEDLHKFVAQNIDELGSFLQDSAQVEKGRPCLQSLNKVLVDSKSKEENLANFARWEPCHGQFMYRHPWKQYLKTGNLTRQCACRVEALHGSLNSTFQAPQEIQWTIKEAFSESGKMLKELAIAVQTMTKPSSSIPHIANLKIASKTLKSLLKTDLWEDHENLMQVIPIAAAVIDTVDIVELIADAVNELSSMANFKGKDGIKVEEDTENEKNKKLMEVENPCVSIVIDGEDSVRVECHHHLNVQTEKQI